MKIRRLDIIGFKSLAERVNLRFDDGTTGVVGPNGCGKSNVVDAIRWVMGEQSARRLRGKNMEDVIFAGSETKAPMGMAEVQMTLENDGHNVPPEYSAYPEITVGRRLFRSGESEYLINRTPCRLLDVQELFMGTGVGTRAYSIIGQGKIGLIISQKPRERRVLIEEAAGISKYNSRKKVAERKMEQTQQNLLRVNDVIQEIKRNINSLKRQARKAARYNKLRDQLREIELHHAAHRYLELQAMKRHMAGKLDRLAQKEVAIQAELARLEAGVEQRRTRLLDDDRCINEHQEELLSVDSQIKLSEKNIEFLTRELESLGERGQSSAQEIERLRKELHNLAEEEKKARQQLADLQETSQAATARLNQREEAYARQETEVDRLENEMDTHRQAQMSLGGQAGELRSRTSTLDQRLVELEGRLGQAEAEKKALEGNLSELAGKKKRHSERLSQARQLHLDLKQRRESSENTLADLQAQAKENEAKLLALRNEIGTRRSRLESLKEIERNYEGCLSGVQWVMKNAQAKRSESEVVGLVADILSAPPRYEAAVQAVLGDRLQSVVVNSQGAGLAAVDFLKSEAEGRSSFIPLSLRDEPGVDVSSVGGPGVIGPLNNLVNYQQEHEPVIRYLLGDVVVVEDLTQAMAIWTANGHKATLVTLEGDVLEPQGVLTGGSFEESGTHLLQNKREIRELSEKLRHLEAEYRMVQDRQGKLKAQLAFVESTIESLRQNSHDEELRIIDQQKDLSHMHLESNSLSERLSKLGLVIEDLRQRTESAKSERQAAAEALDENAKRYSELEEVMRTCRSKLNDEKRKLASVGQDVMELKVQAAATVERSDSASSNLERMKRTGTELEGRIEQLKEEISNGNFKVTRNQQEIENNRQEISNLLSRREKLQALLGDMRDSYEKLLADVREDEAVTKEKRRANEDLSQQLSEGRSQSREFELELLHLANDVRKSHKVNVAECLSSYHLLPAPTEEQIQKAEKIKRTLERMGDVNPHAVETYEENVKRYEFLTTQSQDLEESLEKLQKVIIKINRTSRKRFREAFEAINNKFQEVFPRLFNGGKAYLMLEETQDVLEAGVEIVAQPPGKKLQNMELLSGGEKALTAVALLFSIFLIKPTPFCLLDEVDAPLDDANLDRFNAIISTMARNSQFILITHSKRTMELLDRLYGITMEEPGISRVVSVKLKDIEEPTQEPAEASA